MTKHKLIQVKRLNDGKTFDIQEDSPVPAGFVRVEDKPKPKQKAKAAN